MIHPQKRIAVKKVLDLVIKRVIELKHELVKWNPPNTFVKMTTANNIEVAFPWEYVHLDDILVDLKLSPDSLEIPIPKYFIEDNSRQLEQRDRIVCGYMRLKHNTTDIYLENEFGRTVTEKMTLERAIDIIQKNERGRQGMFLFLCVISLPVLNALIY